MERERACVLHVEADRVRRGREGGQGGELRVRGKSWTQEGESAQGAGSYARSPTWRLDARQWPVAMIPAARAVALRSRHLRPRRPPGRVRRAPRPPLARLPDAPARPRLGAH